MSELFINASNHNLTEEQKREVNEVLGATIIELPEKLKRDWANVTPDNINLIMRDLLEVIYPLAKNNENTVLVHVAGHPALVARTVGMLKYLNIDCYWAFSQRVSIEEAQPDGSILKRNVFKHEGFFKY